MKPLAIDLFCGLGGWTEGLLAEGYYVVGFDIERHDYGTGGYPAQLVLQDVLTLHGSQFRDAALIVASPPCQEYSYMAMPWSRAKAIAAEYRAGVRDVKKLTALFDACFRIQREAIEAAGHFIPLVVENVRGAIPWVGRSRWNFGSFHLWGNVPALMPMTRKAAKVPGLNWNGSDKPGYVAQPFNTTAERRLKQRMCDCGHAESDHDVGSEFPCCKCSCINPYYVSSGFKTIGHANIRNGYSHTRHLTNQVESDGVKQHKSGRAWFADPDTMSGRISSNSPARKAASAAIAKIPLPLARHIARTWKPIEQIGREP